MTRTKDQYECRMDDECPAEEWMNKNYGHYSRKNICDDCPFMVYINHLADIEDFLENHNIEIFKGEEK